LLPDHPRYFIEKVPFFRAMYQQPAGGGLLFTIPMAGFIPGAGCSTWQRGFLSRLLPCEKRGAVNYGIYCPLENAER